MTCLAERAALDVVATPEAWLSGEMRCVGCGGAACDGWYPGWACIVGFPGGKTDFSLCLYCYEAAYELPLSEVPS